MMDALVASEGEPDLLQLSVANPRSIRKSSTSSRRRSGGHPPSDAQHQWHPHCAGAGIREGAGGFKPGLEVYLQFDSLRPDALKTLRGADLTRIRRQALEALEKESISTTLVVVVKRGVNDDELGEIIDYALQWKCVRGITFQPIQDAGRNENFDPRRDRVVLSDIRRKIIEAGTAFGEGDIIPCRAIRNPLPLAMRCAKATQIAPITSFFPKDMLVEALPNAITFEKFPDLHKQVMTFFSLATAECNNPEKLNALLCCLPEIPVPEGMGYENIFRIAIVEFMDAHNFCIGRVKRSCIHFVTPNGQIIPFETYNLFYRDAAARKRMAISRTGTG